MSYLKVLICVLLCHILLTACIKDEVLQDRFDPVAESGVFSDSSIASSESQVEVSGSSTLPQNNAEIAVTSTADASLVWLPENQEISQQFASLLLTKDEELDRYTSLDIAPNNLAVSIFQDGQQKNYSLWLWFDEESRAIVQNQEMIQDGTDKFGNPAGYYPTWYISVEKSNQLREMLKELA